MNLKYKKYIYLLNDITNQLLSKDREDLAKLIRQLRFLVIGLSIALAISFLVNVMFILKYQY